MLFGPDYKRINTIIEQRKMRMPCHIPMRPFNSHYCLKSSSIVSPNLRVAHRGTALYANRLVRTWPADGFGGGNAIIWGTTDSTSPRFGTIQFSNEQHTNRGRCWSFMIILDWIQRVCLAWKWDMRAGRVARISCAATVLCISLRGGGELWVEAILLDSYRSGRAL